MKYLIWAQDNNRYRTKTSWVSKPEELFEGEKMLSFNTRDEADKLLKQCPFKNCASYGINKSHPFFKHC